MFPRMVVHAVSGKGVQAGQLQLKSGPTAIRIFNLNAAVEALGELAGLPEADAASLWFGGFEGFEERVGEEIWGDSRAVVGDTYLSLAGWRIQRDGYRDGRGIAAGLEGV